MSFIRIDNWVYIGNWGLKIFFNFIITILWLFYFQIKFTYSNLKFMMSHNLFGILVYLSNFFKSISTIIIHRLVLIVILVLQIRLFLLFLLLLLLFFLNSFMVSFLHLAKVSIIDHARHWLIFKSIFVAIYDYLEFLYSITSLFGSIY